MRLIFLLFSLIFLMQISVAQSEVPEDKVSDYYQSAFALDITSFFINEPTLIIDYVIKNNSVVLSLGSPFEENFKYSLFENSDKYPHYSGLDENFNRSAIQDYNLSTYFILGIQYRRYILPMHKAEIFPFVGVSYDYKKPSFTIDTVNPVNTSYGRHRGFLASRRHSDVSLSLGMVKLFNKVYVQTSVDLVSSNRKFEYFEYKSNTTGWYDFTNVTQSKNEIFVTFNLRLGYCFGLGGIFKQKLTGYR